MRTRTDAATAAALEVLEQAGKPLHVNRIAELALAGGWTTSGRTPERTIAARLSGLERAGEVERIDRGHYVHAAHMTAELDAWREQLEAERWERRAAREEAATRRGFESGYNCGHCGRRRASAAAECDYCGDSAGSYNANPADVNRAYGLAY